MFPKIFFKIHKLYVIVFHGDMLLYTKKSNT